MKNKWKLGIIHVVFALILYAIGTVVLALAFFPAICFVQMMLHKFSSASGLVTAGVLALSLSLGYFIFGISLMLTVALIYRLLRLKLSEGNFHISSMEVIQWTFVNAFFLIVRVMFMDFIMLTPICSLFYRMMGAKVGANVQINSKNVADIPLLEIGENSVIGGNATVISHSFEKKGLTLSRVKIGKNVIIGLNAIVMPGVEVGDHSVVAAGAIVPKYTKIAPHSIYYSPDKIIQHAAGT